MQSAMAFPGAGRQIGGCRSGRRFRTGHAGIPHLTVGGIGVLGRRRTGRLSRQRRRRLRGCTPVLEVTWRAREQPRTGRKPRSSSAVVSFVQVTAGIPDGTICGGSRLVAAAHVVCRSASLPSRSCIWFSGRCGRRRHRPRAGRETVVVVGVDHRSTPSCRQSSCRRWSDPSPYRLSSGWRLPSTLRHIRNRPTVNTARSPEQRFAYEANCSNRRSVS